MQKASCHDHCPYDRFCYYKGEDRNDFPDECANYYKIDDLLIEARYDRDSDEQDETEEEFE
jgi:hypothetical protein